MVAYGEFSSVVSRLSDVLPSQKRERTFMTYCLHYSTPSFVLIKGLSIKKRARTNLRKFESHLGHIIQLSDVISTSLISNNRLSRSENLVPA